MKIVTTTSSFCINDYPENLKVVNNPLGRRLSEEEVLKFLIKEQPVGMVAGVEPLTRRVLEQVAFLKVISRCGVGMDSVDLAAAKDLGIKVFNTPVAPVASVSEMAFTLALSFLKRIPQVDHYMKQGQWNKLKGNLLEGKTVGILGCGRIGTQTARLFHIFGCSVLGFDPYVKDHSICQMVGKEQIIAESDILSLHLPVTEDTMEFINARIFEKMKTSAILINTARGNLVEENDLYKALKERQIAGAALDVFCEEPYSGPLTDISISDRIILSPHIASSAVEGRKRMETEALKNLLNGLKELGLFI
ncbi:MAG: phosphoglycerate dehydrogenase [Bacteroidetes bacterium]|nr:phosphoglycerate dehydrogenase [Bacteroidota bacterium]